MTPDLLSLDPVPALVARVRAELAADFPPGTPVRVSRAPGRLDVMGGIADYTGSLVCEYPLDRAAAVALSSRSDRNLQVFSFNLYDEHKPFTFRVPLEALAVGPADALRRGFDHPGRKWAAYVAGCLFVLHEQGYVDLRDPGIKGMNLAVYSTVPAGAGVSSSAALEVAAMMNLAAHFGLLPAAVPGAAPAAEAGKVLDAVRLAVLCQAVENRIVGAPCGVMDQVTSSYGEAGALLRMVCQPHELGPPLAVPEGVRFVGVNSNVKHSVGGGGAYGRTRCAAFMGHKVILEQMRELGAASGYQLVADPTGGYLANLDPDDYKRFFRPAVPEVMKGRDFLARYGPTADAATAVDQDAEYAVRQATDHHVLEARRVKKFAGYLESAAAVPAGQRGARGRGSALDRAGHLMYASHGSYTNDAMLGADECDLLVRLVRQRERAGLYGARITGGGSGGTVAVLADEGEGADAAIAEVLAEYEKQTGREPEAFTGTSPGAWHVGTALMD